MEIDADTCYRHLFEFATVSFKPIIMGIELLLGGPYYSI
jgi:hypothetical protein